MTVKIVTDSSSDLPPALAKKLGITVAPLYVRFGEKSHRDGVDITADAFYEKLVAGPVLPVTSAPSPGSFTELYEGLAKETREIVSIHLSSKLSGTYEAAQAGKREVTAKCRIEVVDSRQVSMGVGLPAILAAKAAAKGAGIDEVVKMVNGAVPGIFLAGALDTLEFLEKGGRIGRAQAMMGAMLNIKPILSVQDGEVVPLERVRTHSKAVNRLYELLEEHLPAREISVVYSTEAAEGQKLLEHAKKLAPGQEVYFARFGPILGTYVGPGTLAVIVLK
ncbi:MAG: DegV family protein [Chloroflexi bacterium]|nr:DegV family protein [Chloroflexota bacterium]